jgi:polysaccharide deacetylase 2 family uncharacterized protein YibQ
MERSDERPMDRRSVLIKRPMEPFNGKVQWKGLTQRLDERSDGKV